MTRQHIPFGMVLQALLLLLLPQTVLADCYVLNVYRPDTLTKGRSVSIQLPQVIGIPKYDDSAVDELRIFAADKLKEKLDQTRYFGEVKILADDEIKQSTSDLRIATVMSSIDEGSTWRRAALGGFGAAKVRLRSEVFLTSGDLLADIECQGSDAGGIVGGGGWTSLFHSDRHLLENNLEKAGEQIARSFPELEDEWTKRKKRGLNKGEPLVGTNETITGFWRERRIADWTIEEYKHEVDAFVVETSTEDWHIAHALWVNNSSFRANDYLNKAKPAEGELLKGGDVGKGFLLDLQPIAALDGKDLYIIAITFSNTANWKDKLPFFGLNDPIGEATYLSVTGAADQRVKAVQTINLPSYLIERRVRLGRVLWRSRPIVFAFPATKSDGTPLIDNLDDDIELHSAIEGHDVRVRFHLRDLLVSDVSELKLKLSSSTN